MFGSRFKVNYRAELPFIAGLTIVFGLWTRMHHNLMIDSNFF